MTARPFDRELAQTLCDLEIPKQLQFSPNGKHVLYATSLHGYSQRKGKYHVSTLWLASTTEPKTVKQLTSGEFNDTSPVWHPNGNEIAFLSDRAAPGSGNAVWTLRLDNLEPVRVSIESNKASLSSPHYSPDGKSITYVSQDERSQDYYDKKERGQPDPIVWNGTEESLRLRIMNLETKEERTLTNSEQHVLQYAWGGSDGKKIVVSTNTKPDWEEMFNTGTTISLIDVQTGDIQDLHTTFRYVEDITLGGDGNVYMIQTSTDSYWSSGAIFSLDPAASPVTLVTVDDGSEETADTFRVCNGTVATCFMTRLGVTIRTLDGKLLFERPGNHVGWDVFYDKEHDSWNIAASVSTINTSSEVVVAKQGEDDVILTEHGKVLKDRTFGKFNVLKCQSGDGKEELDGFFLAPASSLDASGDGPTSPQPTVVIVHGGPGARDAEMFAVTFYWVAYLLSQGYAVLQPQYRGSYGRGTAFASVSATGCGREANDDIVTITDNAIKKGFADPERLVIAGWSNGGLHTFLCSVRNGLHGLGWHFKAAIAGAGMSDLESLCFSSDIGSTGFAELNDSVKPWTSAQDETRGRKASAVWQVAAAVEAAKQTGQMVIPPMLILHGDSDGRVPFEQSVGFWRALRTHKLPCEFVQYPGQGHSMSLQIYWLDLMERVARWCDMYIGKS